MLSAKASYMISITLSFKHKKGKVKLKKRTYIEQLTDMRSNA